MDNSAADLGRAATISLMETVGERPISRTELVTRQGLLAAGVRSDRLRGMVRRGELVSLATGVFAAGAVAHEDSWARYAAATRAFVLASPDTAVAADWSAVALLGLPHPARPPSVPSVIRQGSRRSGSNKTPRGRTRFATVADHWVLTIDGTRCLHPAFVAVDLARSLSREWGLILADAAAAWSGSTALLQQARAEMRKWPRIAGAIRAVDNADPDSESPLESGGRSVFLSAHPVAPRSNVWLGIDRPTARVDQWWDLARVAAEGDGIAKYGTGTTAVDRLREEKDREFLLREWGVRVLRYDWTRVFQDPDRLRAQTQRLLAEPLPPPHPRLRTWSNEEGRAFLGLPPWSGPRLR